MRVFKFSLIISLAMMMTGCIRHYVERDYPRYLQNNTNSPVTLKKVISYKLTDKTINHETSFQAVLVGYAHIWIVNFGKMLDETLKSPVYSSAFTPDSSSTLTTTMDLESYKFSGFRTYFSIAVTVKDRDTTILTKTYSVAGNGQAGKAFLGGPFAMKNAIQQSTKYAIDDFLAQLINDLKQKNIAIAGFQRSEG